MWSQSLLALLPRSFLLRCLLLLPLPLSPPRTIHTLLFAFPLPLTPPLPRTMRCTLPPAQLSSRSVPLSLSSRVHCQRARFHRFHYFHRTLPSTRFDVRSLSLLLPLSLLRCSPSLLRCSLPMPSFPLSLPPRTAINPFRRTARLVWSLFLLMMMSLLRCSLPLPLDLLAGATLGHSGRALPNV